MMTRKWNCSLFLLVVAPCYFFVPNFSVAGEQVDIDGPPGSVSFGARVAALPNGNIVITDPQFAGVGAAYLYDSSGNMISKIEGGNNVGASGPGVISITVLSNGNYVLSSPLWRNGAVNNAGAVTWASGTVGVSGVVSEVNSLVGSSFSDKVGSSGIMVLPNGNYLARSGDWNNGDQTRAGAVTWGDGVNGTSGIVSSANSLVGSAQLSGLGFWDVVALTNGNYVVWDPIWGNQGAGSRGAVTWGDGRVGISGYPTVDNSLVGAAAGDNLGSRRIVALSNGNYVVSSHRWSNDAGAVTWCDGATGTFGPVSAINSMIGGKAGVNVGDPGVVALANGNYVVASSGWEGDIGTNRGAVTWGNGATGTVGVISATNSLVGASDFDFVGNHLGTQFGVNALVNGNYVVVSTSWDDGINQDVGAVTWADGNTGLVGTVSSANSLIGRFADDRVGTGGVTALSNGNYVVGSVHWRNASHVMVGATTWGDGVSGTHGMVQENNSLTGSKENDAIGGNGVTALRNGNYVVSSPLWDNGLIVNAGAVTLMDGRGPFSRYVSSANSLVGSSTIDFVGQYGVVALSHGDYVVTSSSWDSGSVSNAGAVTWGSGTTGVVGPISSTNSLIGTKINDNIGNDYVSALANGYYAVSSLIWNNGEIEHAGAVSFARGALTGEISSGNSVLGTEPYAGVGSTGGAGLVFSHDPPRQRLVVGRFASNIVTIFNADPDVIFTQGMEGKEVCPSQSDACLE